ncbi:hypothetical protein [Luteimonas mephitis]|jgi:hypothetical protein|uniref:hypothetical protein n=1 Tax=Luteimonas mephitis TaxID=83615 RepID=UPI003A915C4B
MRRPVKLLLAAAAIALLLAFALHSLLQPRRVTGFVLDALGKSLGLEITATGASEYRLRGAPLLVVRNVAVREPGAGTPLLRAQRMSVSVPWSTVRSRGARLDITRIELDAPVLDLPALQHWLASRPPGETRMPTLSDGLQIRNGRIDGRGWRVDGIAISLPRLHPEQRVGAQFNGRFTSGDLALRFRLAIAMTQPANNAGIAVVGPVTASSGDWRLPATLHLSAPLHFGDDGIRSARLRARMGGRYESGDTRLPFAFAITSPLLVRDGTLALAPAGIALRGGDVVPDLDAGGRIAYGKRLLLDLDGRLADWPAAWPALPPPIGGSHAPLPFTLDYLGRDSLDDVVTLGIRRRTARFDTRFRMPVIARWIASPASGSPLPPLAGRLVVPQLDVSGARLEGVEVEFQDASAPPAVQDR